MGTRRTYPLLTCTRGVLLALLTGVMVTVALAWTAAVLFPPHGIDSKAGAEAERIIESDGWWYRQTTYRHTPTQSPLAWAAWMSEAHCYREVRVDDSKRGRDKPAIISRAGSTDLAAIPPSSSADWLMPWFEPGKPDAGIVSRERHLYAYGWPLAALGQVRDFTQVTDNNFLVSQERTLGLPDRLTRGRQPPPMWSSWTLPAHILWLGLVLDTATFGAVIWSAFALQRWWRVARRRRHGLCVVCGYDLRATPPGSRCPECGRAVVIR